MTPEEFDIMIGGKRTEALAYASTTAAAFQHVIDWATKQRDAALDMKNAIAAVLNKDDDDQDDYR